MSQTPSLAPAAFDRAVSLERLANETFDVLVIGGGITGAGVALDAAARGLRTALVERRDFASGTSSKSSKLVHGGLRYLQQREFRLVYENLAERQRLLRNAPHLVHPLPFLIPLFGTGGVVDATVAKTYATALFLYDMTGGLRIGKRHRRISKAEAVAHLPSLRVDKLAAGFVYYDARADDARLTLAVLRTAADRGAVVANYAEVVGVDLGEADQAQGPHPRGGSRPGASAGLARVTVSAVEAGEDPGNGIGIGIGGAGASPGDQAGTSVEVRARVVVNATGVWADQVRALDEGDDPQSIRPAKGIHLTVPAAKLPCDIAAVIPVHHDRRSIFIVPWGDQTFLGTTDTDYDGPLADPVCTPEDVDYVLGAINAIVTTPIGRDDVTGSWAGLRPLLKASGRHHGIGGRTADMSRRHTVSVSPNGMVTITGGKLTTYRKMAADTVDVVVTRLGGGRRRSPTSSLPLHGATDLAPLRSPGTAARLGIAPELYEHLLGRYGAELTDVVELARDNPELAEPLVPGLPYIGAEAVYAARHEMARSLDDVLSRRTRAVLRDARSTAAAASAVAELLAGEWGWDVDEACRHAEAFSAHTHAFAAAGALGGIVS